MSVAAKSALITSVVAAVALVSSVDSAHAQRKPQPACGIKALPFVEGYEWVYLPVQPPEEVRKASQKVAANKPKQPDQFTVKVLSVTTEGPRNAQRTKIVLEETAQIVPKGGAGEPIKLTQTVTLECGTVGRQQYVDVPPQSFLYAGEPGYALNLTLGEIERGADEHTYKFQLGSLRVPEWIENLKSSFERNASEGTEAEILDGSVDLQRIVKVGYPEDLETPLGKIKGTPVQVEMVGSVFINFQPKAEEFSVPANTINKLWLTENIGVVQIFNSNGHMFQLFEAKLGE